jgi:hypothetical protein
VEGCRVEFRMDRETVIGCGIVSMLLGGVGVYLVPRFLFINIRAMRAEVPSNVDMIAYAEISYHAAFGSFVAAGSRAEAESDLIRGRGVTGRGVPRDWTGGSGWDRLGWGPEGRVRGAGWRVLKLAGA